MYATCLYCNEKLGKNEVIEHFPVGRRLAFDPAKGRLWAVCRKCERWNLSPIEERWEAIEECERLFRDTKLRVSTDNIGLARVAEGLELVRVGNPQRPEMAAWRYGDQFGRRRRRYYTYAGLGVAAIAGVYVVGPALGLYAIGGGGVLANFPQVVIQMQRRIFGRAKVQMPWMDEPLVLQPVHLDHASLIPDDSELGWALRLAVPGRSFNPPPMPLREGDPPPPRVWERKARMVTHTYAEFTGEEAVRIAGKILPKINRQGGDRTAVDRAVRLLEDDADPRRFFARQTRHGVRGADGFDPGTVLKKLPRAVMLAMEMSAHEDAERRALEGELAMLEAAWKEADEIAGISDNLLLPDEVEGWFARLKRRR